MDPLRIAIVSVSVATGLCGMLLLTWYLCVGKKNRTVGSSSGETSLVLDATAAEQLNLSLGIPGEPLISTSQDPLLPSPDFSPTLSMSSRGRGAVEQTPTQEPVVHSLARSTSSRSRVLRLTLSASPPSPCTSPPINLSFSQKSIKHFDPVYERL